MIKADRDSHVRRCGSEQEGSYENDAVLSEWREMLSFILVMAC